MVTVQCRLHSGPALAGRLCGAMVMNIGWRCRVLEWGVRRAPGLRREKRSEVVCQFAEDERVSR